MVLVTFFTSSSNLITCAPPHQHHSSCLPYLPFDVFHTDLLVRLLVVIEPLSLAQIDPCELRSALNPFSQPITFRPELNEL